MSRKCVILIFMAALFLPLFFGCEKKYAVKEDETDKTGVNEDNDDYTGDGSDTVFIALNGTSITAASASVSIDGSRAAITKAGTYCASGTLSDGQLVVNSSDTGDVRIILRSVNINCSNSAPINVKDAGKVIINLAGKTQNYLSDGTSYTYDDAEAQEPNAAIFSKADLTICGDGALTVTGNFNDGISGKDGVIIKGGSLTVTAADDGIRGKDYLIIRDGSFDITAGGKGLKSDNEDDSSLGFIIIDKGTFNINSVSDAVAAKTSVSITYADLTAKTTGNGSSETSKEGGFNPGPGQNPGDNTNSGYDGTLSAKGIKGGTGVTIEGGSFIITSADDALHSNTEVTVNGGEFLLSSGDDAVHAENTLNVTGGTINVTKCYEGFESASINVSGGYVNLASTDDSFNATKGAATESDDGSMVNITGGTIALSATTGDGLDSNGSIKMSAGTVIVQGPTSSPELALDYNGTFNISGGLFIGSGPNSGNMIEATSTSSAQNAVKVTFQSSLSSSTLFHIEDGSGKNIVTFQPVRSAYYIVFSSPDLVSGTAFNIYTGGTYSGSGTDGLYTGGTYSGGTLKKNFTVSGKVTSVSI